MRPQNLNAHWNWERILPNSQQSTKKQEGFVGHKEKTIELLSNINPPIFTGLFASFCVYLPIYLFI